MHRRLSFLGSALALAWLQPATPLILGAEKTVAVPKSAATQAFEAFERTRAREGARPDAARFQNVIEAGMAYLLEYPAEDGAAIVVRGLATFGNTMPAVDQAPSRAVYLSQLAYVIVNARLKEGLSVAAQTAVAALDAAEADSEERENPTNENLDTLGEKIDTLTKMPGSGRFLAERERSYFEIVVREVGDEAGAAHLNRLLTHADASVVAMARDELKIVEIRKAPFALTFTALDGKPFDFGRLRGKVVALAFWTTGEPSRKELTALKAIHTEYRDKGFEVVAVSRDKVQDRESVGKFVKDNRLTWPVYLDGAEGELGEKLNVRDVPTMVLFDQKGILVGTGFQANRVEREIKQLLGLEGAGPAQQQVQQKGGKRGGKKR